MCFHWWFANVAEEKTCDTITRQKLTATPTTVPNSRVLNLPQNASATKAPTTGAKLNVPEKTLFTFVAAFYFML